MSIHPKRSDSALRRAILALGACILLALPALATEVVQVRVGKHPDFTRVVFELDGPARYRVEKHEGASPELVVTINAASRARTIRSKSEGIKGVEVTSQGQTSVARVALRKPGLRLKEMILANPSRIVLDLVHGESAPKPVAKAPAPAPKPAVAPKPVARQPEPAPKPSVPEPAPEPIAKTPVVEPPAPKPEVVPAPEVIAKAPSEPPAQSQPPEVQLPQTLPAAPPKPVAPVAKPVAPKPQPTAKPAPAPKRTPETTTSSTPPIEILAGVAVGVLLCVVGLVVLLRRRRPGSDEGEELGAEADADAEQRSFTEMVFSETEAESPTAESGGVSDLDSFFDEDHDADGQPESRGDDVMDQGLSDLPTDRGAAPPPPGIGTAAGSSPDPDVLRVVHELERRMGQLEGRLAEANEARERLERQVAAQSEELRVQRAAIARTQRALRSLSRGDDDKATEPALRDEDTQAKTRINV